MTPTPLPLVSVILPVFNGGLYVRDAIRSALIQTYPRLEVIVIDDGSAEPIEPLLAGLPGPVQCWRTSNRGVAAARNFGIAKSKGEFIAFLDQDDVWLPDKLEKQVRLVEGALDVALVHSDVIYRDERIGRSYLQPRWRPELAGRCYRRLFLGNAIVASTVMIRRSALAATGPLDETLRGTDDYDIELRLARRFTFGYVDDQLIVYRLHHQNWSHRTREMLKNELVVIEKAIRDDPDLPRSVGDRAISERMFMLLEGIGYSYYESSEYQQARPYLQRSLRYGLRVVPTVRWISTWMPAALMGPLRRRGRTVRASRRAQPGADTPTCP